MDDRLRRAMRALASLKLTVILLALSIFLIFAGTWAQIDMGIWKTLETYFRSFFVIIPFQIFFPRQWEVPGGIPYPGGYTLGGLLFVNLVTAHAVRFKFTRRRAGILLIHFGLLLLLGGEFVTALFAREANMTIDEGQTVNYTEDIREVELAFIDTSDPERDMVIAIPEDLLEKGGAITHPLLPFTIQVEAWYPNARLVDLGRDHDTQVRHASAGVAQRMNVGAVEIPVASGVDQNEIDLPVAFVSLVEDGRNLGEYMASLQFMLIPNPQEDVFEAGGKTWRMALRYKRTYKPYRVQLLDFKHDRYPGTEIPRNFSSRVRLMDPERNVDREVLIWMNHPLRYQGETFYQASFKRGDTGTVLQVVRNPGWLLPYIACTIGALGMLVHFGMHLVRFVNRRQTS